jgi:predicted HicB family RNase H-like nuclease
MTYKGYKATIEFDDRDDIFVGRVEGMQDRISFHGSSVAKLEYAFHAGVEAYLESCRKRAKKPDRQ